ncbi:MAG: hypothetical protein R3F59_19975 [Myxococcota bacterium]
MLTLLLTLLAARAEPPAPPDDPVAAELLAREPALLQAVRDYDPAEYARILRLKEIDRAAYVAALFRVARAVDRARNDPDAAARRLAMRDKEQAIRQLARGWAALPPAEQATRRAALEAQTRELLAMKQAERRARLDELRARLEALEADIQQRDARADALVQEYVDQLLAEKVDL